MVEVSLTVGKLDASLALLLTKDHHLIEFPTILLPNGVRAGSIIKIKCDQDFESEKEEAIKFNNIQDEILNTFATNLPESPNLKIKNVTQTSCVLEWDKLNLGTSNLKNLILFKDGKKLGSIPQPLTNRTSKLSGLPIDKSFKVQLRLDTTAGVFLSNEIEVTTHKMTDLSGITVCLGDLTPNDQFTKQDIEDTLKNMGAKFPAQTQVKVDTTHFLCTRENKQNPEYVKANDMNIPIIRPEWLKACERERRIVGVRDFYVKECVLPDLFAKNYWQKNNSTTPPAINITQNETETETETPELPEKDNEPVAGGESRTDVPIIIEPTQEEEPVKEESAQEESAQEEPTQEEPAQEEAVQEEAAQEEAAQEEVVTEPTDVTDVQVDTQEESEEPADEPEADITEASEPIEQTETKEETSAEIDNEKESETPANEVETTIHEDLNQQEPETGDIEKTKQDIDDAFDSVPLDDENAVTEEPKPIEQEQDVDVSADLSEPASTSLNENENGDDNENENEDQNDDDEEEEEEEEEGDDDEAEGDANAGADADAVSESTENTSTPGAGKKKKNKKRRTRIRNK